MKHSGFVHLHVHTQYSLLDGACRLEDLIEAVRADLMPAVAITDHGNLFGAIEFYHRALEHGVKPIIGCEVYVAPGRRTDRAGSGVGESFHHLTLLAKDHTGYRNLMRLASIGYLEGFYYKPRIDREVLASHHDGLIALGGCLNGEIGKLIEAGDLDGAGAAAGEYQEMMGKDNFYLELMDNGLESQRRANPLMVEIARKAGIPIVATNDVHYIRRSDAEAHDALLCIQTGKVISDTDRLRFATDQFYLRTSHEMMALFSDHPEAIRATVEVAERCNLELEFHKPKIPSYPVPGGMSEHGYLEVLCREGIVKRYGAGNSEALERLEHELSVIRKTGYASYFLIVWDFIHHAKSQGWLVGPGRGSAAGSLVAYVLGITEVDPLRYGLVFERFLNPDRARLPDIDVDFCDDRRDDVIAYVTAKYGQSSVAQIITFGTMAARAAVRDVGRVMNLPLGEVDRIAKLVPAQVDIKLEEALEAEPELKRLSGEDPQVERLLKMARALEGLPRHASTHAAGVVICAGELGDHVPLFRGTNGEVTTQYAMDSLEKIGLLKVDFLGLRTLTVIRNTLRLMAETRGERVSVQGIPLEDAKTYELLKAGRTIGVFQLESSGMRDLLRRLEPERIDDIIAVVGLYRPGPLASGMVDEFIKRKHDPGLVEYDHPELEPILRDTYGTILFQEQIMHIVHRLGGFTLAQADVVQRSISKKIPEVMDQQRDAFVEGAVKKGFPKRVARKVFELMAHFAGYGFNKSHSTAYALIAYWTAYLKANYPVEFMAALLSSEMGDTEKVVTYINEARESGIRVLPPDVNESYADFTVVGGNIRFGLGAVKNVGAAAVQSVVEARNSGGSFGSLYDFTSRVDLRLVNRKVVESLIKAGAFDSFSHGRARLFAVVENALEAGSGVQRDRVSGQRSFLDEFEMEGAFRAGIQEPPEVAEWPESNLLAHEKEVLGFYVTGHPLAHHADLVRRYATRSSAGLTEGKDGEEVSLAGVVTTIRRTFTRKGERMAYMQIEDLDGTAELVVFPRDIDRLSQYLKKDALIYVRGKLDRKTEEPKVVAREIFQLAEVEGRLSRTVHISIPAGQVEESTLARLREILAGYPGDRAVYLHLEELGGKEVVILSEQSVGTQTPREMAARVEDLLGRDSTRFLP